MLEDEVGTSEHVWNQLVELGWTGLLVPEDRGGLGLGLVDMAVVLEEMGRVPFPGPYLSSAVLATIAAGRLGLDDQLRSLAAGATRGTIAVDELGHGDPVDRIRTRAKRKGGQWRLHGLKPVVLDGASADWALVPARTQEGIGTFLLEAPEGETVPTWDHTRRVARLDLDGRAAERVGPDGDHTAHWRRIVDDANVALCCDLLGVMEQAHHLAVEYAKVRVQFDRPIATFQVIKHKAVDMLHAIELTRVGTHYAAWTSDVEDPRRAEAVAMAMGFASESANAGLRRVHPDPRRRRLHLGLRRPPLLPPGQAGRPPVGLRRLAPPEAGRSGPRHRLRAVDSGSGGEVDYSTEGGENVRSV